VNTALGGELLLPKQLYMLACGSCNAGFEAASPDSGGLLVCQVPAGGGERSGCWRRTARLWQCRIQLLQQHCSPVGVLQSPCFACLRGVCLNSRNRRRNAGSCQPSAADGAVRGSAWLCLSGMHVRQMGSPPPFLALLVRNACVQHLRSTCTRDSRLLAIIMELLAGTTQFNRWRPG